MATHSSVLAWRIPGAGEPGGLTSMGSHRVRHDWSDLAAAAAAVPLHFAAQGDISLGRNTELRVPRSRLPACLVATLRLVCVQWAAWSGEMMSSSRTKNRLLRACYRAEDFPASVSLLLQNPLKFGWRQSGRVQTWSLSTGELMLLNCGAGEDSWESLGLQGDPTSPS